MGYSASDAAHDAADAQRAEEALAGALETAHAIGDSFTKDWRDDPLSPSVTVNQEIGAEDQPVFVFSLLLELEDDLDADDYPGAEVDKLRGDLRSRIVSTRVDEWDWIVTTGTKAGAARR